MFFPSSSPFPSYTPPAPPSSLLYLIMQHIALLHSQYLCTTLHCTTLQCTALHCSKLQFLHYTALHSFAELYTSVRHCNLLDLTCIAMCTLDCTVLYCTVLYSTKKHFFQPNGIVFYYIPIYNFNPCIVIF